MQTEEDFSIVVTQRFKRNYHSYLLILRADDFFTARNKAEQIIGTSSRSVINLVAPRDLLDQAKFILTSTRTWNGATETCGWSKNNGWVPQEDSSVTEFDLAEIDQCLLPAPGKNMARPEWTIPIGYYIAYCRKMICG